VQRPRRAVSAQRILGALPDKTKCNLTNLAVMSTCAEQCYSDILIARMCVPTIILDEWNPATDSVVLRTWLDSHADDGTADDWDLFGHGFSTVDDDLTDPEAWQAFRQHHTRPPNDILSPTGYPWPGPQTPSGGFLDGETCMWFQKEGDYRYLCGDWGCRAMPNEQFPIIRRGDTNAARCASLFIPGNAASCDPAHGCTYTAPVAAVTEACAAPTCDFTPGENAEDSCKSTTGCTYTAPVAGVTEACREPH